LKWKKRERESVHLKKTTKKQRKQSNANQTKKATRQKS
jgi:hypothetical protein